ncbi:NADH:ubiquinone reductase (Na(+)-transporting) subunit E [Acanthopleuribacter pedis]|uniref:Na(+)-translocating NADH-quinone reductase subunit E n=1 Tax=Acanthopleuribacter pedis TaxID=442870 RepID=A0A8J7QDV3_9BACT|nr:NADH:ubiquinone reductase (Na(+)-transporting) subunit E [Acanthopleuribacter pedis]MBO1319211.1 NADH:ubiquinone reductase (Na(+)-transporting) subunit E [Acanthopleuribacter pedis]
MEELFSIATKAIFIENILLANFLGMCSFLACSKKIETAVGLGFAVMFVLVVTTPVNWIITEFMLKDGALAWLGMPTIDLSFLQLICYIAIIAAMVQLVEMILDKFSPTLYNALGIFLPLIAVNCAILGTSLFMNTKGYGFVESTVFGLTSGIGWLLAIVGMAAIRTKLQYSSLPPGLRGLGITMIITGLMAIGFMSFIGINI